MLTYSLENGVATLALDDGKANAVGFTFIEEMNKALDQAEGEANAIVITGREGKFSAGFDLSVMKDDPMEMIRLVGMGGKMGLRIFASKLPVVAACTGHAMAMGAFILLCSDTRYGIDGPFKLGLNETAIGMVLPEFGIQMSKARIPNEMWTEAVIQAKIYDPQGAVQAKFLDEIVPADQLLATAQAKAEELGAMPRDAYYGNKMLMRREFIEATQASFDNA